MQVKRIQAETALLESQKAKTDTETSWLDKQNTSTTGLQAAQMDESRQRTRNEVLNGKRIEADTRKIIQDTDTSRAMEGKTILEFDEIAARIRNLDANTTTQQTQQIANLAAARLHNMEADQIRATIPAITAMRDAEAKAAQAGVPGAQTRAKAWQELLDAFGNTAQIITNAVRSAAK